MSNKPMTEEDDLPWVPPQNQAKYEVAAGKFLIAYNQMDYRLGKLLECSLYKLDRADLVSRYKPQGALSFKLEIIDVLLATGKLVELGQLPIGEMREIHRKRNLIVHSHYDANPFDDSYQLVPQERSRRRAFLSLDEIDDLISRTSRCNNSLLAAEAGFWFDC